MTDKKDVSNSSYVAGITVLWSCFVTTPMWLMMTYGILTRINAPTWLWGMYYAYIPTVFTGIFMTGIFRVMQDQERKDEK